MSLHVSYVKRLRFVVLFSSHIFQIKPRLFIINLLEVTLLIKKYMNTIYVMNTRIIISLIKDKYKSRILKILVTLLPITYLIVTLILRTILLMEGHTSYSESLYSINYCEVAHWRTDEVGRGRGYIRKFRYLQRYRRRKRHRLFKTIQHNKNESSFI